MNLTHNSSLVHNYCNNHLISPLDGTASRGLDMPGWQTDWSSLNAYNKANQAKYTNSATCTHSNAHMYRYVHACLTSCKWPVSPQRWQCWLQRDSRGQGGGGRLVLWGRLRSMCMGLWAPVRCVSAGSPQTGQWRRGQSGCRWPSWPHSMQHTRLCKYQSILCQDLQKKTNTERNIQILFVYLCVYS